MRGVCTSLAAVFMATIRKMTAMSDAFAAESDPPHLNPLPQGERGFCLLPRNGSGVTPYHCRNTVEMALCSA